MSYYYSYLINSYNNKKKQLLDPFGVICKLALLTFYEKDTKVGIYEHIVNIQPPTAMQGMARKSYGDSKEDISILYGPIKKAIDWYVLSEKQDAMISKPKQITSAIAAIPLTPSSSMNNMSSSVILTPGKSKIVSDKEEPKNLHTVSSTKNLTDSGDLNKKSENASLKDSIIMDSNTKLIFTKDQREAIKIIVKYAIKGLKSIQATYGEGNVVLAIQLFINYLSSALDGTSKDLDYPGVYKETDEKMKSIINVDIIKNIWKEETITQLSNLFLLCDKNKNDEKEKEGFLNSIESILKTTDSKFKEIVLQTNVG